MKEVEGMNAMVIHSDLQAPQKSFSLLPICKYIFCIVYAYINESAYIDSKI
jgi:hypothetical protein